VRHQRFFGRACYTLVMVALHSTSQVMSQT
jgi:hypothetical protein